MSDYNLQNLHYHFPVHKTQLDALLIVKLEMKIHAINVFEVIKQCFFSLMGYHTSMIAQDHHPFGEMGTCPTGGRHEIIFSTFCQ